MKPFLRCISTLKLFALEKQTVEKRKWMKNRSELQTSKMKKKRVDSWIYASAALFQGKCISHCPTLTGSWKQCMLTPKIHGKTSLKRVCCNTSAVIHPFNLCVPIGVTNSVTWTEPNFTNCHWVWVPKAASVYRTHQTSIARLKSSVHGANRLNKNK